MYYRMSCDKESGNGDAVSAQGETSDTGEGSLGIFRVPVEERRSSEPLYPEELCCAGVNSTGFSIV